MRGMKGGSSSDKGRERTQGDEVKLNDKMIREERSEVNDGERKEERKKQ